MLLYCIILVGFVRIKMEEMYRNLLLAGYHERILEIAVGYLLSSLGFSKSSALSRIFNFFPS